MKIFRISAFFIFFLVVFLANKINSYNIETHIPKLDTATSSIIAQKTDDSVAPDEVKVPETGIETKVLSEKKAPAANKIIFQISKTVSKVETAPKIPKTLLIPSIGIEAKIVPVGTDRDGKMSVPTLKNTVGWYERGTIPGLIGSAVLDAHVYLAFKNLKNVSNGADIYVADSEGRKIHFVVTKIRNYPYNEVPAELLFNAADAAHLNLITCSGAWISDSGTYDHRLVIYATRVE